MLRQVPKSKSCRGIILTFAACTMPGGEPITVLQLEDGSQVEATLVTAGVRGLDSARCRDIGTDEVG